MTSTRTISAAAILLCASAAHAGIYKCVDADGHTTYTNDQTMGRGCKALVENLPVSSIPAPRAPAAKAAAGAAGFPRVSADDQRARDDSRRKVLEDELAGEERSLAEAKGALAEQESIRNGDERNYQKVLDRLQPFKDKVELHQRNVDALKREIANLK